MLDPYPEIRAGVLKLCERFDMDYWARCEREQRLATEFFEAMRDAGWLSVTMPESLGGAGLPFGAVATMMQAVAESGGGWTATTAVHGYLFGPHAIVVHGTPEQHERMLKPLVEGRERPCFAVTEANTGLDTTRVKTRAVRNGDVYLVSGEKVWITGAAIADRMMILARTTPIEECVRPMDGLSLFYTRIDRRRVEIRPIPKHGVETVASCVLIIDELPVPVEDRIGEEGKGFRYLLDSINPERIMVAAEAVGMGRAALQRAAGYAAQRRVFDRPIGQNQSVQHPLARNWMELEAANLMVFKAAALYERGMPCGAEANAAKFLAAEAAHSACRQAMLTHGGFGYAREYHVERLMRESMLPMIAPLAQNLALSFVAERVLGLPKSY
ncbi:MAG: acyl-CoA/acyl-ACP dehydrogenase [Burkholderiales bacterium]|nr:acyl-CoA/acyl-ACP dehydrogenase [Burkholderiales bacterium]